MQVGGKGGFEFREFGLLFVRFEEVANEVGPGAPGRCLDDVQQARDLLGDAPRFRSKPDGADAGDVENPLPVLQMCSPAS